MRKDYQKDKSNFSILSHIGLLICSIFLNFFQNDGKLAFLQAENSEVKAVWCLESVIRERAFFPPFISCF